MDRWMRVISNHVVVNGCDVDYVLMCDEVHSMHRMVPLVGLKIFGNWSYENLIPIIVM